MNNLPRQKLCEIVNRFGHSISGEPRRCEGLLRDYCGTFRREIAVLVAALEERVAADLLAANAGLPREVLFIRLAQRLHDNLAMDEGAARWAVGSWALALGVISSPELAAMEQMPPEEVRSKQPQLKQPQAKSTAKATPAPQAAKAIPAPAPVAAATRTTVARTAAQTRTDIVVSAEGNGDYASISEALRSAPSGARLLVRPGLYRESVNIDKEVEIIGDGPRADIIIESINGSCILVRTDEAVVRGFTLRGMAGINDTGVGFFAVDIPQGRFTLDDCDIASNSLSCIGIHNDLTDPVITGCKVHTSADSGIYIFSAAAGRVEECDIYGNTNVGVAITEGARPVIRRCVIHDGRSAGVVAWDGGTGLIEECEIFGNAKAGVGVSEAGDLIIRRCRIYGGENSGVFVHNNGRGTLEDCDIYGHREAEVAVTRGGNAVVRGCQIHAGQLSGVILRDDGQAALERCDVYGNADAGVSIHAGGVGVIRQCRINGNGHIAIRVETDGAVEVEDSDLTGNRIAAFETDYGAIVESRGNRL